MMGADSIRKNSTKVKDSPASRAACGRLAARPSGTRGRGWERGSPPSFPCAPAAPYMNWGDGYAVTAGNMRDVLTPQPSFPGGIRVAIVEDKRRTREGLRALIDGSEGFVCVGAWGSMEEALAS